MVGPKSTQTCCRDNNGQNASLHLLFKQLSFYEDNDCMHAARHVYASERVQHAMHVATKWLPTINLATKCTEKVSLQMRTYDK